MLYRFKQHKRELASYLSPDAAIVHSKDFEKGVVKVIGGEEDFLTPVEKVALRKLLIIPTEESASGGLNNSSSEDDLIRVVEEKEARKRQRTTIQSKYRCLDHVTATSTLVEQINSIAKFLLTDMRKSMYPRNLEILLMLKYNRWLWDIDTVNKLVMQVGSGDVTADGDNEVAHFDENDEIED